MKSSNVSPRLELARRVAVQAGTLQLAQLNTLRLAEVRLKSRNNFVTRVDLASEKIILTAIRRAFPEDAVLSEEAGAIAGSQIRWIIDPLDGTSNYIHKIPFFGVSIAIAYQGIVQAGALYVPSRKELFWAQKGKGAFLNGRRIQVSKRAALNESLVGTAIPYKSAHKRWRAYEVILKKISRSCADIRRSGAMAVDLAYVACGRIDGMWAFDQAPWDLAAGELLVREAGGITRSLGKNAASPDRLCANPALLKRLQRLLTTRSK